jgi:uncharacterized pyridoxamine 5'-phosphate oxidase family protein
MKYFVFYGEGKCWITNIKGNNEFTFVSDFTKAFDFGSLRAATKFVKSIGVKDLSIIEVSHWYDSF